MSKELTIPEILAIFDRLNSRFKYPFEFKCDPIVFEPQDRLWFFHHGLIIMQRFYTVRVTEKKKDEG